VLRSRLLIRASLWLERFLYRHADRVMVNSPGFIEHVTQRGARWVELVPNGAEPEMFDPEGCGQHFRERHGLAGKYVILYAGAHGMSNDLRVILQSAALLRDLAQVQFVLIGDGKEKARLQTEAERLELPNVLFLPPIPKEQMGEALAASDACVAILKPIELYKTTYPNKVFDYMAAGRPVILAIDGVIRQVVEKAGAGVFVPPGSSENLAQAARRMAADPERGRAMGTAGCEYIHKYFNRRDLAEKLALVLEDMGSPNG
jgi:glycosyltransferase involved in cell wall biosynthesis